MEKTKLTKVIASTLLIASALALNPVGAHAEWKQDSKGKWYADGASYYTGWHPIDGNFYYFNTNGYMAVNTTINNMQLGSDGKCQLTNNTTNNINKSTTNILPYQIEKRSSYLSDIFNNNGLNFKMSGEQYSEGFTLCHANSALFNLGGKYDNIQFMVGHIDDSSNKDGVLTIYLDGKESKKINLKYGDIVKTITIPVNKAAQMKFEITYDSTDYTEARYGFTKIIGY